MSKPFHGGGGNRTRGMFPRSAVTYRDWDPVLDRTRAPGITFAAWRREFRELLLAANPSPFDGTPTNIYVVEERDGPLKIGVAVDPHERLRTLQNANPRPLRLVVSFPGTHPLEHFIHAQLRADRIRGEWFAPTDRVLAIVDELIHVTEICEVLNEGRHEGDAYADIDDVRELFIDNVAHDRAEAA